MASEKRQRKPSARLAEVTEARAAPAVPAGAQRGAQARAKKRQAADEPEPAERFKEARASAKRGKRQQDAADKARLRTLELETRLVRKQAERERKEQEAAVKAAAREAERIRKQKLEQEARATRELQAEQRRQAQADRRQQMTAQREAAAHAKARQREEAAIEKDFEELLARLSPSDASGATSTPRAFLRLVSTAAADVYDELPTRLRPVLAFVQVCASTCHTVG